jgi:hypothetical protein
MRWQPALITRLGRVRDVRMRLAELELTRDELELAARRQAEQRARDDVVTITQRSRHDIAEADQTLLTRPVGGRHGITDWHGARKRAARAVVTAQGQADEASSERVDQDLACSAARRHYRQMRLDVERMELLCEGLAGAAE